MKRGLCVFLAGFVLCGSPNMIAQQTGSGTEKNAKSTQSSSSSVASSRGADQAEIDKALAELGGTMKELAALDESDREIAKSNQRQIETTQMLDRQRDRIMHVEKPQLQERAAAGDKKRRDLIASGCPADGGNVPAAVADRCNPQIRAVNAEYAEIKSAAQSLKDQLATIDQGRDAVSETTLNNAQKTKANNARRADLLERKKLQEQTLLKLQAKTSSCEKLLRQRGVSCEKIKLRCGMVQFDGSDPDLPPSPKDSSCK